MSSFWRQAACETKRPRRIFTEARLSTRALLRSIVIGCGFALASLRWEIAAGLLILFAAIYVPVIRGEEQFLRGRFANYADYCARVPRLLPRLSAGPEGRSQFSSELYLKHREYNSLLGTLALIAALAARKLWMAH